MIWLDYVSRACHKIMFLDFKFWGVFFGCLFIVEMDPKDEILLQNEVLPCKNIIFVYKGKSQNIQRKFGIDWFWP